MKEYLSGAFDMHIHTSPDVGPRKLSDIGLAERLRAAGMGGALLKCHSGDTAPRAAVLNELFPDLHFAGGVVLNRQAGGLNPYAVEACGRMGGRFVWFPTMDSLSYQLYQKSKGADPDLTGRILLLDDNGELKREALNVLEAAARYDMTAATGHVSAEEGMAVVRAARSMGVDAVLTHADLPSNAYSDEQQKEAVRLGACIEHCYFTSYYKRVPIEEIARQIRVSGCGSVYLSTDFGQPASPFSDEGIEAYAGELEALGFTPGELSLMFREVPARLLRIPS